VAGSKLPEKPDERQKILRGTGAYQKHVQLEKSAIRNAMLIYADEVAHEHMELIRNSQDSMKLSAINSWYEHVLGPPVQEVHTQTAHLLAQDGVGVMSVTKEQRDATLRNFLLSPAQSDKPGT